MNFIQLIRKYHIDIHIWPFRQNSLNYIKANLPTKSYWLYIGISARLLTPNFPFVPLTLKFLNT